MDIFAQSVLKKKRVVNMGFWKKLGKAIIAEPTMKDVEDIKEELSPENLKHLNKKQIKMIKEELKEFEEYQI